MAGKLLQCGECGKRGVSHQPSMMRTDRSGTTQYVEGRLVCRYCHHVAELHPRPDDTVSPATGATTRPPGDRGTLARPTPPPVAKKKRSGPPRWLGWAAVAAISGMGWAFYQIHTAPPPPPVARVNQWPRTSCPGYQAITVPAQDGAAAVRFCGGLPYPPAGINSKPCLPTPPPATRKTRRIEARGDAWWRGLGSKQRERVRARRKLRPAVSWCQGSPNNHGQGQTEIIPATQG